MTVMHCPPAIAQGANVNLMTRLQVMQQRREWRRNYETEGFLAFLANELTFEGVTRR